jgi:hypothetical protein
MDAGPGTRLVAPCTASFAVQDPVAGLSGLSAGHCGAPAPQNTGLTVQRAYLPNVRLRLGAVIRGAEASGFDALEHSIDSRWGVAQPIERGDLPPLTVLGVADDLSSAVGHASVSRAGPPARRRVGASRGSSSTRVASA